MKEYRKSLLISVAELKTNTIISGNVDDKFLLSAIMTCQEVHLEDLIGTALYHRIQELIYNTVKKQIDNINAPENEIYRTLLDEYIKPFLKSKCTVELLYIVSYKMKNAGMVKTSDTNVANADMDELENDIIEKVIKPVFESDMIDIDTKFAINPTGKFVIGGAVADTGLTGR